MKFCDVCDNMLYIKLRANADAPATLQYVCKKCGNSVDGNDTSSKSCIIDTNYVDDQTTYKQYATPYIGYDPTLPRVNNIPCPNKECSRPEGSPSEIIFVKYDFANLKYLYHCTHCKTFWKSGPQ
jgi:DNA-directed RNA polymerase subunit M/transcription elongation factor TFIIS